MWYHHEKSSASLQTQAPRSKHRCASPRDEAITETRPPGWDLPVLFWSPAPPDQSHWWEYNEDCAFLVSLAAFDVICTDPGILQKHEARSRTESLNDCLEEMKTLAADICITRQKYFLTVAYLCHLTVTVECLKIFQIRSISRYVFFINKQKCSDNLRK